MSGHLMCDGTLQFSPGEMPKDKVIMYLAENITAAEYWTEVIKTGIDRFGAESFSNRQRTAYWRDGGKNGDGTYSIYCSECGAGFKTRGHARSISTAKKFKLCPTCGARMIEQESENERTEV